MELKILNYSDNKYFYSGSFFEKPFIASTRLNSDGALIPPWLSIPPFLYKNTGFLYFRHKIIINTWGGDFR